MPAKETPLGSVATLAAHESLYSRAVAKLGPERVAAMLGRVKLSALVPDVDPAIGRLSAAAVVRHIWPLHRRLSQTPPPGNYSTHLYLGGRGAGKTKAGCEWLIGEAERAARLVRAGRIRPQEARLGAIAATANDARTTLTEGPSGLLAAGKPWFQGTYQPALLKIVYPAGVEIHLYSSERPDRLRGPNFRALLMDELCAWHSAEETYSTAMFALRLGDKPRSMITTTPRASKLLKAIMAAPTTVITRAATADNRDHLNPAAIQRLYEAYGSSRLGRQELFAELLEDVVGALWTMETIERSRVAAAPAELRRVVTAVDPSGGSGEHNDECGIVTVGIGQCSCKGGEPEEHMFVLADDSGRYSPQEWARAAVRAFEAHQGDRIVAETNFGGAMVEATLRQVAPHVPFKALTASRGKLVRAEPISAAYEAGRVHHVGHFAQLEDQMCEWSPLSSKKSPDRMDALVWAATELLDGSRSMFDANWSAEDGGGLSGLVGGGWTSTEMGRANATIAAMSARHSPWGRR